MASIEVSLSTTPRRKKGGSISGGVPSPAGHRNRDHYKDLDALRVALRDKENIIQTWVIAWLQPWDMAERGILITSHSFIIMIEHKGLTNERWVMSRSDIPLKKCKSWIFINEYDRDLKFLLRNSMFIRAFLN